MNRESLTKLRFDRRLLRRKGWVDPKELESALEALPDVGAKATTLGEIEDQEKGGAEEGSEPGA